MMTQIVSMDDLKDRMTLRGARRWSKNTRQFSKHFNEVVMAKMAVDVNYLKALQTFHQRIAEDQALTALEAGKRGIGPVVSIDSGRQWDKILIGFIGENGKQERKMEVRYFVQRGTGMIYGPKSANAPNKKMFFGTLDSADKWNWGGEWARPKDLDEQTGISEGAQVIRIGKYGDYEHYEVLTDELRDAALEAVEG